MTDSMVQHFDACLGCMACVTACPSGVQYDRLIEDTRAQVERRTTGPRPTGPCARRSSRCSPTRGGCGRCAGRCGSTSEPGCRGCCAGRAAATGSRRTLAAMEGLAPPLGAARAGARADVGARDAPRRSSACCSAACSASSSPASTPPPRGCSRAEGFDVVAPRVAGLLRRAVVAQRTRGRGAAASPAALIDDVRGGRRRRRRGQLRRVRLVDEGVRRRCSPTTRRRRERARRSRPRSATSPSSSSRSARSPRATRCRSPSPTTTPATSAHAQGIRSQPRELLARHTRAGAAGDRRRRALLRLGRHLQPPQPRAGRASSATARPPTCCATGAELLVTANPGCLMQVAASHRARRAAAMALAHTVEVLDASIRGLGREPTSASRPSRRRQPYPCATTSTTR